MTDSPGSPGIKLWGLGMKLTVVKPLAAALVGWLLISNITHLQIRLCC